MVCYDWFNGSNCSIILSANDNRFTPIDDAYYAIVTDNLFDAVAVSEIKTIVDDSTSISLEHVPDETTEAIGHGNEDETNLSLFAMLLVCLITAVLLYRVANWIRFVMSQKQNQREVKRWRRSAD
eukprot:435373_1